MIALLLAAGLAGPPEPAPVTVPSRQLAPEPSWRAPLAVYCGSAIADLVTTEISLANGGRELNPFMQRRGVRIPFKLAGCAFLAHRDRIAQRRRRVAAQRIAVVAVHAGLVGVNLWRASKGPR